MDHVQHMLLADTFWEDVGGYVYTVVWSLAIIVTGVITLALMCCPVVFVAACFYCYCCSDSIDKMKEEKETLMRVQKNLAQVTKQV